MTHFLVLLMFFNAHERAGKFIKGAFSLTEYLRLSLEYSIGIMSEFFSWAFVYPCVVICKGCSLMPQNQLISVCFSEYSYTQWYSSACCEIILFHGHQISWIQDNGRLVDIWIRWFQIIFNISYLLKMN